MVTAGIGSARNIRRCRMRQTQVLVASEYAPVRRLLTEMVSAEEGFRVVGEAGNDVEARALARQIRPDVVLLDSRLPYVVGYDEVRLSRVSGLDSAMAITEDVPAARVVLLSNLDSVAYRDSSSHNGRCLVTDANGIRAVFTLHDLCCSAVSHAGPVFANVDARERATFGNTGGGSYMDFSGRGRAGASRSGASRQTPGETLMVVGAAMVTFSLLFFFLATFSPLMGSNPYVGIFAWFSMPLTFIGGLLAVGIGFLINRKGGKRRGYSKA